MTFDEEKEKAFFEHRLEVRRIWLDKLLLAGLIGLAGFIGNWIFEGYKSDLAKTQFLLENRLQALKDIRGAYSALVHHAYLKAVNDSAANPATYSKSVEAFMNVGNQWGFLFSSNFDRELMHYAWLHQAMADPKVNVTQKSHWEFIYAFSQAFDTATRTALNVEILGAPREAHGEQFRLRMWRAEEVNAKGTLSLFRENLEKWQKERKAKAGP